MLQIRPPQYWRIEVPSQSDGEKAQVEQLKDVLEKVLLFEKTPCPFKRNFTVQLPEPPLAPVRKRPWKPVQKPKLLVETIPKQREDNPLTAHPFSDEQLWPSTPITDSVHSRSPSPFYDSRPSTATTRSTDDHDIPKHEIASDISPRSVSGPSEDRIIPSKVSLFKALDAVHIDWAGPEGNGSSSDPTDDINATPRAQLPPSTQSTLHEPLIRSRPQAIQNSGGSIMTPPVLSIVTSAPKPMIKSQSQSPKNAKADSGFSSSVESFQTVQSWHSPLSSPSPSPLASEFPSSTLTYPYPHNNIALPKQRERDAPETPSDPDTSHMWETNSADSCSALGSSPPPSQTPTLVNDSNEKSDEDLSEAITPRSIRSRIRSHGLRSGSSRRRGLSPLPASINLFSPPRRRLGSLQTAKHLPTAIIQKTYEILVSPPGHLLHLMLNIASKIAAGEWRGVLPGHEEALHWDFEDQYGATEWNEDDYGVELFETGSKPARSKPAKESKSRQGGSWEVG